MTDDRRLIEEYLPIEAISKEASREKSVRKGHISTLHLWWARRPLVACRAAVYGALVPASRFIPENGPDNKKQSLGRANAAKFVERLCQYPGSPQVTAEAQKHILEAHAERLSKETGKPVTVEDIVEGRAPRPKVLDMFAGGGAIPLEALRLGCEAYALDLNPVAHIIELCTLVYPQKYGKPDPNARGMTGPKNAKGDLPAAPACALHADRSRDAAQAGTTWGGLAEEVRYWGNWVLEKVKAEIGDLYPLIPDPEYKGRRPESQTTIWNSTKKNEVPPGFLMPVAYLWTRTVRCKNRKCGATVPLVRQTWLCKKKDRYVALKMITPACAAEPCDAAGRPQGEKKVRFEVVESRTEKGLGFDPASFSKAGNATCPFCGTVADSDYVKAEGCAKRMGQQMMAVVCTRPGRQGKVYLSVEQASSLLESTGRMPVPREEEMKKRIEALCRRTGLTVPNEPVPSLDSFTCKTHLYGLNSWGDLFTPRQMLCLLTFAAAVRDFVAQASRLRLSEEHIKAVATYLGVLVNRQADYNSTLCSWHNTGEKLGHTFGRQALPMVWDFAELGPFGGGSGSPEGALDWIVGVAEAQADSGHPATVSRGSATALPWPDASFDAVITDPPYYDNVSYANLSDFFYVWLRRTVGHLYPEHFASEGTPKKSEAVAEASRHGGSKDEARRAYEKMMAQSFREAHRVLKSGGQMTVVYAHKTTLGWSTLVDALRCSGFTVLEAWPIDTEMKSRLLGMDSAALASSIFLVARKRDGARTGSYENQVRPELEKIVRERVDSLWNMGITGADLVIAAVGAGLRAFTRFARVEYANGEEVPAEKFLAEVEGVVLETLLEKIFGMAGSGVAAVDGPSRFYVLWRHTYKAAEMDAGEAIVFTYGQNVELDGPKGLSTGRHALVEKKKGKYRLRDFTERGEHEKLGLPENGTSAPLIDALHRILWLVENQPRSLNKFLDEARPDRERLRLVAQALAGRALSGGSDDSSERVVITTVAEQAALKKLLANWRALIDQRLAMDEGTLFDMGRKGST
jgi:putative DNA methylase